MGLSSIIIKDGVDGTVTNVAVAQGGAGSLELMPATLNRRHRVKGLMLTLGADGTIKFRSNGIDLTGPMDWSAKGGAVEVDLASLIVGFTSQNLEILTTGGPANGVVSVATEAP